jgi:hypothetical protein
LYHVIEGKKEERVEVRGGRGRRSEQLLDDLKEKKGLLDIQRGSLDCTLWRSALGKPMDLP